LSLDSYALETLEEKPNLYQVLNDGSHNNAKIRSKTLEPVLGHLINYLGMKRIQARGIHAAVKHVLMASLCHNLKRLIKHIGKYPQIHINTAIKTIKTSQKLAINHFLVIEYFMKYQVAFKN
jgi:hypothetical protein